MPDRCDHCGDPVQVILGGERLCAGCAHAILVETRERADERVERLRGSNFERSDRRWVNRTRGNTDS